MIGFLASLLISRNPAMTLPWARRLVKIGLSVALALIVGIAFVVWLNGRESAAEERGRSAEREAVQRETIEQVEQSNAVRNEIERQADRRSGSDLYAVCMRSARNPEQCEQFLPQ